MGASRKVALSPTQQVMNWETRRPPRLFHASAFDQLPDSAILMRGDANHSVLGTITANVWQAVRNEGVHASFPGHRVLQKVSRTKKKKKKKKKKVPGVDPTA